MAHPITFKPAPVDPHAELMRRVEAAPRQHAEALLVGWDLLQTAHDQGILDLLQGLIGGKDIIAGKLAEGAALPETVAAIRNGIALARVLAAFDPEVLQSFAKALGDNRRQELEQQHQHAVKERQGPTAVKPDTAAPHAGRPGTETGAKEKKPPSLWRLFRSATSADARRGIGFATTLLTSLGRATTTGGKH